MSDFPSPKGFYSENHNSMYDYEEERVRSPFNGNTMADYDNIHSPIKRNENLDMFVPDRILVVGQDQYFGTTAPPRELRLENSVRPPDPGLIRVETPPRVISLMDHRFPTVGEDDDDFSDLSPPTTANSFSFRPTVQATPKKPQELVPCEPDRTAFSELNNSDAGMRTLQPTEELTHLRRQMAKLNRRLMAIELENIQRQQREKYLVAIGLGYYLLKFLFWLNK